VATVVGSLVSLLILSLHGVLELNGQLAQSYLLFLLGSSVHAALFLLLGAGISVLTRNSASALVFLVTAWTLIVVVVPQTAYLVAVRAVPPAGNMGRWIGEFQQEQQEALIEEGLFPRSPEIAATDGYTLEKRYARRVEELVEEGDREIRGAYRRNQVQYDLARAIHMISPGYSFQYAVESLLGAGVARFQSFHAQGYRYRDELRAFLREKDAADASSPHVPFLAGFMSTAALAADEIPRFVQKELALGDRVAAGTTPIAILILETGLAFLFAVVAFQRVEVG